LKNIFVTYKFIIMESNIIFNGWKIIIILLLYNLINKNIYYIYFIKNLLFNITPIYFLILINMFFIIYIICKAKIRINFSISFN
jgi:hypothetical protein